MPAARHEGIDSLANYGGDDAEGWVELSEDQYRQEQDVEVLNGADGSPSYPAGGYYIFTSSKPARLGIDFRC